MLLLLLLLLQDGRLTLEEFRSWYAADAASGSAHGNVVVDAAAAPPISYSLSQVRHLTNLHVYPPQEVNEVFASVADETGSLRRSAFVAAFRSFIPPQTGTAAQRTRLLLERLFDIFDVNHE